MRRACTLIFCVASVLLPATLSVPANAAIPPPAKKKAKTGAKPVTGKSRTVSARAMAASQTGRGQVVQSRLVRTKSGKLARVIVHAPPPPSFQLHPDPERYVEIQKALAGRGYFKGEPNGEWGDDSTDALRRFQAGANLPDDGKINALTLTGLGLGPRHDGSSARDAAVAPVLPPAPTALPADADTPADSGSEVPVPVVATPPTPPANARFH